PGHAFAAGPLLHDRQGIAYRRERIAQLVGEHREKLVLAPFGLRALRLRLLALGDVDDLPDGAAHTIAVEHGSRAHHDHEPHIIRANDIELLALNAPTGRRATLQR